MRGLAVLLIYIVSLAVPAVHARVFNYKDSGLAAYIRGTGGTTNLGKEAFDGALISGTKVNGTSSLQYGGEAGAMFGFGPNFYMRVGLEVIQHAGVKAKGSSAAGVERFELDSSVFVFNPNVTFEYFYKNTSSFRFFTAIGAGYADITVDNRFVKSATSDLSVDDFNEKLAAKGMSGHFLMGVETLFVDNVALAFDVGYRYLPVKSLTAKSDYTGFNGAVAKGADSVDSEGKKRTMDLGGITAGVTFRFYLNFL